VNNASLPVVNSDLVSWNRGRVAVAGSIAHSYWRLKLRCRFSNAAFKRSGVLSRGVWRWNSPVKCRFPAEWVAGVAWNDKVHGFFLSFLLSSPLLSGGYFMLCKGGDLLLAFVGIVGCHTTWLFCCFFFFRNIGIDLFCGIVTFFLFGSEGLLWIERTKMHHMT